MNRLTQLPPSALPAEQREVYDEILRSRGTRSFPIMGDDGTLLGPFGPMVTHPEIGGRLQELGAALRYGGTLPARTRELVILTVAAARSSAFEWQSHSAVARSLGISDEALEGLRQGQLPDELDDTECA